MSFPAHSGYAPGAVSPQVPYGRHLLVAAVHESNTLDSTRVHRNDALKDADGAAMHSIRIVDFHRGTLPPAVTLELR